MHDDDDDEGMRHATCNMRRGQDRTRHDTTVISVRVVYVRTLAGLPHWLAYPT